MVTGQASLSFFGGQVCIEKFISVYKVYLGICERLMMEEQYLQSCAYHGNTMDFFSWKVNNIEQIILNNICIIFQAHPTGRGN